MKIILGCLVLLMSASVFANPIENPLCLNSGYSLSTSKNCAKSIFWKDHIDTYYGARLYLVQAKGTRSGLKSMLAKLKREDVGTMLRSDYSKAIDSAESLAVIIEENDLPDIKILAFPKHGTPVVVLEKLPGDYFILDENPEITLDEQFGLKNQEIIDQYER